MAAVGDVVATGSQAVGKSAGQANGEGIEIKKRLVVAISSRALFDMMESHKVFEAEGLQAYGEYQLAREEELLKPGAAFSLVQKLLALNSASLASLGQVEEGLTTVECEVVLLSRNSSETGLRVFNSIEAHGLHINRAAFTGGREPFAYMPAFGAQLFLSADSADVRAALAAGHAAALLPEHSTEPAQAPAAELRIAFDGDAVLFADEAEQIFQAQGLQAFLDHERDNAHLPMAPGPLKPFLQAINVIQQRFPSGQGLLRTALITARGAPAHQRAIRTMRSWGIRVDEALFLAGSEKAEFLQAFGADLFFDDQWLNCESAQKYSLAAHVPHGVVNP